MKGTIGKTKIEVDRPIREDLQARGVEWATVTNAGRIETLGGG